MMAVATWMVASTNTGPSTLGNTWRQHDAHRRHPGDAGGLHVLFVALHQGGAAHGAGRTAPTRSRVIEMINTPKAKRLVGIAGTSARPTPAISKATKMAGKDSMTSHGAHDARVPIQPAAETRPAGPGSRPATPTPGHRGSHPPAGRCAHRSIRADKMSRPGRQVPSQVFGRSPVASKPRRQARVGQAPASGQIERDWCGATQGGEHRGKMHAAAYQQRRQPPPWAMWRKL
jgi:hypothetical protein